MHGTKSMETAAYCMHNILARVYAYEYSLSYELVLFILLASKIIYYYTSLLASY